jgi:hypothetical protein
MEIRSGPASENRYFNFLSTDFPDRVEQADASKSYLHLRNPGELTSSFFEVISFSP